VNGTSKGIQKTRKDEKKEEHSFERLSAGSIDINNIGFHFRIQHHFQSYYIVCTRHIQKSEEIDGQIPKYEKKLSLREQAPDYNGR
jgi:hypothetical protein